MKQCRQCFSVHDGKKWTMKSEKDKNEFLPKVLCEACKRKRDKIVHGIVYLNGPVLEEKKDEVMRMLLREEEIETSHNHLSQILDIEQHKGRMVITTINQWMALHLGRQFKKTYKGSLKIDRDTPGRRGRGEKGREEVVVHWKQAA